MADKMTKRDLFGAVIGILTEVGADESLVAGMLHEVELLDRKAGSKSVDVKRKAEQDAVKRAISEALTSHGAMRATEIASTIGTSTQRVTALAKQMVEAGELRREVDKKVVRFTLT